MTWQIRDGDCRELMAEMPETSIDAIITDPPYGLEFMGVAWDTMRDDGKPTTRNDWGDFGSREHARTAPEVSKVRLKKAHAFGEFSAAWAGEALRVLKPGGHLLAFGGTRTYHRLACALEDAGFEIRDCISWLYGSGFPKSLDVSKAIDNAAGVEREVVGCGRAHPGTLGLMDDRAWKPRDGPTPIGAPATPDAEQWDGWGTALKPAWEPIIMARKPLTGTVAENVREHRTGALNIDACRIRGGDSLGGGRVSSVSDGWDRPSKHGAQAVATARERARLAVERAEAQGRWPANVAFDAEAAAMLDEQTGELVSGSESEEGHRRNGDKFRTAYGEFSGTEREYGVLYGDRGGASRFFYVAKPSRAERDAGLDRSARNFHPTVKPIELMRWLCRLVCPPYGTVLDPFAGAGTTGCAAALEGVEFLGFEREREYAQTARARIAHWSQFPPGTNFNEALASSAARAEIARTGQLGLDIFGEEAA